MNTLNLYSFVTVLATELVSRQSDNATRTAFVSALRALRENFIAIRLVGEKGEIGTIFIGAECATASVSFGNTTLVKGS